MVEHESHSSLAGIDFVNAVLESGDQVVHRLEQHIGQDRPFQMTPESLNQIEVGTIRRQPLDLDPLPVPVEPVVHGPGVVVAGVVADQSDLAAGVGPQQQDQEVDEVPAALGVPDHRGDLSRGVVHRPVHHLLFVFAWGRYTRLVADSCPHPGQERVLVDLGFVLEKEDFGRVPAERFFFKVFSSFWALSWARSSRLPLSVCFGRCRENCS